MRLGMKVRQLASIAAATAAIAFVSGTAAMAQAPNCSVWLVESSRFMKVPFGAFMPDRAFVPGSTSPNNSIPTIDLWTRRWSRQWLKKHGIHDREDGGVGANSESKRQNSHCAKPRIPQQAPEAIAKVLPEEMHGQFLCEE